MLIAVIVDFTCLMLCDFTLFDATDISRRRLLVAIRRRRRLFSPFFLTTTCADFRHYWSFSLFLSLHDCLPLDDYADVHAFLSLLILRLRFFFHDASAIVPMLFMPCR